MNRMRTFLLTVAISLFPMTVIAQIVPDGSTSTTVETNGNVSTIEAGERAGNNLFHSFQDFSVMNGMEANFNNGLDIERIFSRVTGGNVSNIDGLIRANGSASLFLINPAGVVFSDGARLDIGGSFYGTTADSILFPDGVEFAANEAIAPALTINAPIGLSFRDNPGNIAINSSILAVDSGQSLNLLGGEITIDGASLNAFEGTVNLGAMATAGIVTFTESALDFGNLSLADINLNNEATVNVNRGGGGTINVNAQNLTLANASIFNGGLNSATSTPDTQAGNVTINVSDNLTLESGSLIRNNISADSSGNAGDISITAQNLTINDESGVVTFSQGAGNTGNITIGVTEEINLNREGRINSQVDVNGVGDAGDITLNTESLSLTESSLIFSNVFGQGNAGQIDIIASDRIILDNSNFQARVESGGIGNSGDINLTTGSLSLTTTTEGLDAAILASTEGEGNAGNINIEATDIALVGNSLIQTQVEPGAVGTGGNITITTDNLSLTGNSRDSRASLLANSSGNGDAGDITLNATENITLNQFGLILSQGTAGEGDAGTISLNADQLTLSTGSLILSNTGDAESPTVNNIGDAGDININSRIINIDNFSSITNSALSNATGEAGNLTIDTDNLTLAGESVINVLTGNSSDGGTVTVNAQNIEILTGGKIVSLTESSGDAGNINLNVSGQINIDGDNPPLVTEEFRSAQEAIQNLEGRTGLFANTANTTVISTGNGGNVQIANPETFSISNGGEIAVDSQGTGNGGNLTIEAGSLSLENQSQLIAETESGQPEQQPSNITLDIDDVLSLDGDSRISAQAFTNANGGNVTIDAQFVIAFPGLIDGNDIVANASGGAGGNINITAEEIFGLLEGEANPGNMTNDLDVSSEFGFDGNLSLNTPDVDASEGARDLPKGAISTGDQVQQACSANSVNSSSLSLKGRGNIPRKPTDILSSNYLSSDDQVSQTLPEQDDLQNTELTAQVKPIITAQGEIYPAQGLRVTETGAIILTRVPNHLARQSTSGKSTSCLVNTAN